MKVVIVIIVSLVLISWYTTPKIYVAHAHLPNYSTGIEWNVIVAIRAKSQTEAEVKFDKYLSTEKDFKGLKIIQRTYCVLPLENVIIQ